MHLRFLNANEVRRLVWEGVQLIDARSAQEFHASHLKGALHLTPEADDAQWQHACPNEQQILVCYSNRQCRAERLALRLRDAGYAHVYVLGGGLESFFAQQAA